MNLDVNLICRVCLQSDKPFHLIYEEFRSRPLANIVTEIAKIAIDIDDKLPQQICHECTTKFIAANDIRCLAISSDTSLREYIKESSRDAPQEVPEEETEQEESKILDETEMIIVDQLKQEDPGEYAQDVNLLGEDPEYPCDICGKKFTSHVSMSKHRKYHLLDGAKCPVCQRKFYSTTHLKRHYVVHRNMKDFPCTKCPEIFSNIDLLYAHSKRHQDPFFYMMNCDLCVDFKTISLAEFRKHMAKEHNISGPGKIRPYVCSKCGKKYTSKFAMDYHEASHENNGNNSNRANNRDRNFLCATCGKGFYTKDMLETHVRLHTGQRPFKCDYTGCQKAFKQLSTLNMHKVTHTGERAFSCEICGKSFLLSQHRRVHMLTHSDIRAHICNICNHSFRHKHNLTAHMLIHTGKKPHVCTICSEQFAQISRLRQHMKKKHSPDK